ncbi:MAG: hypothetical protein M3P83_07960 [Actinomycetota bacterium]|nr:hypothetical protein [Actinomycetota bacterium]
MRQRVKVLSMGTGEYAAEVTEGENTTHHRVIVSDGLLDDLGAEPDDGVRIVEAALHGLLDREPGTAIEHDVNLDRALRERPELFDEIRASLP